MIDYGVFDSLFDSAIVIDQDRKILYCNEAAAALAGSSVRRLTRGVVFSDAFALSDRELFPMSGGEVGRESPAPMREIGFTSLGSGRIGRLQVTVQPFSEQGLRRWIILMHDVTLEETLHSKYQGELEQKEVFIRELQEAKAKLEDYSANLERMVDERTREVRTANQMLKAIMNSLGQGFLVFDAQGICSEIYTKACEHILEAVPAGLPVQDVLKLTGSERERFGKWLSAVFSEALPFESLVDLAPNRFAHSQARFVTLDYYPIREDDGTIRNLVLVATDRTREHEAEQALLREQQYVQMVLKIIRNRDQFGQFLNSARSHIVELKRQLSRPGQVPDFAAALRTLHTLEGEAALFSAFELRETVRECQEVLEPFRSGKSYFPDQLTNELHGKVRELESSFAGFWAQNRELLDLLRVGTSRSVEVPLERLQSFARVLTEQPCPPVVRERFVDDLLKQPLTMFLRHLNDVAQHVAKSQGKLLHPVNFDCDRVRVIPGDLEPLLGSLVHVFRNAVDHGIEMPEDRKTLGKAEAGSIHVRADEDVRQGQRWIRLTIADDGQGIDPARIRAKLATAFPEVDLTGLDDHQVIQNIFMAGFSSRDSVGQFSGRGIGMDAVRVEVERLGGRIWVDSVLGMGTTFQLEFPAPTKEDSFAKSA